MVIEKANGTLTETFFEIQLKTHEWVTRSDPELAVDLKTWLSNPDVG